MRILKLEPTSSFPTVLLSRVNGLGYAYYMEEQPCRLIRPWQQS